MELPLRIVDGSSPERVISVDGAWGAPGLNLSHWPGNTTPRELKHDLSTGIALNFARLADGRRRELAHGCTAIANNHFDTDGVCAAFAVRHPEAALARAALLLEAAEAGDLFRFPSERALIVDELVGGLADAERSPWRSRWDGADERAKHQFLLEELVGSFAELLDGGFERFADLWRPPLEAALADRGDLAGATRDDVAHLDLCVFSARPGTRSTRAHERADHFDPGRHALFGSTAADRVLVIGPQECGTTYRFILNTTSWFDLVSRRAQPRPDLEKLAGELDRLEGTPGGAAERWHAQDTHSPAPELWFGVAEHERFAEHAPVLRASRLAPAVVRRAVIAALRACWEFPD